MTLTEATLQISPPTVSQIVTSDKLSELNLAISIEEKKQIEENILQEGCLDAFIQRNTTLYMDTIGMRYLESIECLLKTDKDVILNCLPASET